MANLNGGEHTIKLNLYSYAKLLGTTRPGPEERHNFSYSRQLSAKIYPIYGDCTINPTLATANLTTVELTLPAELKVNDHREYLEVIFKVIDNKGIYKSSPLKVTTGSSGKLKASGNVEGLNGFDSPPYRVEVNVKKHLEFKTGPTSKVHQVSELARATSSATSNPQELEKLSLTYQIFTGNLVKAGLRSVLNLALYNSHGHPVKGYNINVDGKSALTGAGGQGPVNFDLEAGERLVELQFGKYGQVFKSFNLTLAPLEVKKFEL